MLSKEEFINALKDIQDLSSKEDSFCTLLENMGQEGETVCAFIYNKPINTILRLLGDVLEDKDDDIGYFLYDMDAISNPDLKPEMPDRVPTDFTGKGLYPDVENLYDYLVNKMVDKNGI